MIMHRKAGSYIALLAAALLLSACGNQQDEPPPTDTKNPLVEITSPATTTDANYELTGIALDGTGIDSLTYALNDGDDTELDLEDNRFEASLTLKAGANDIEVTVTDTGGNEDSDSITVTYNAPASGFGIDTD